MKHILKIMILASSLLLAACQNQLNEEYLMVHPALLKKEADRCQLMFVQTPQKQTASCKTILATFSKFMAIVTQQEIAPEEFGKRIIKEQMQLANTKKNLVKQRREIEVLKRTKAKSSKIINAVTKLNQLERQYKEDSKKVAVLLAVIGMSTPG